MRWLKRLMNHSPPRSEALRLADVWERRAEAAASRLEKDQELLDALLTRVQRLSARVRQDLEEAERVAQVHSTAMEAIRSENKILADVTVKTLVAQHELVLQRTQADTAAQVRRQVAAQPERTED